MHRGPDTVPLFVREYRQAAQQRQQERRERVQTNEETDHYEDSSFVRDDANIGRNDPCPCGSGAKCRPYCG